MSSGALNITGKELCNAIGIAYRGEILRELRNHQLVSFFKIGKKFMYPSEDVKKVSDKLRNGDIKIKTDNGYYIAFGNLQKTS